MPVGGSWSKFGGGKITGPDEWWVGLRYGGEVDGGSRELYIEGYAQYARQGKGSLSGLRM
jgi:hypothetical protein